MAGSIDAAFAAIMKDCQAIAAEAVKSAAMKAQDDIIAEADKYLQYYYDSYKPKKYKRTKQLKNAIKPIFKDNGFGNGGSIEIGVKYDASPLMNAYHSNSWYHKSGTHWIARPSGDFDFDSQNNGIPEAEWILDNFLRGQHGGAQQDFNSTNTLMLDFFDNELPNRINQYVQESLFGAITSRL